MMFSTAAAPFYICTVVHKDSKFSIPLHLFFLEVTILSGCAVGSQHGFDLHFLNDNHNVGHLFMCLLAICLSLEKFLFKLCVFLLLGSKSSFCILDVRPLSDNMICKTFLTFCGLSFHFLDSVL